MNYFKITHIPKVKWSSDSPFNIKPSPKTLFFLFFGLSLFGLGEALLIVSKFGVTPWTVFAEGVAKNFNISIGLATFLVSISILILWVPLKQKIGIGTISNAIIIAFTIDLFVYLLPISKNIFLSELITEFKALTDCFLPTNSGATMFGNTTMSRSGSSGKVNLISI